MTDTPGMTCTDFVPMSRTAANLGSLNHCVNCGVMHGPDSRAAAVREYARLNDVLDRTINPDRAGEPHPPLLDTLAAILEIRDAFPELRLSDLVAHRHSLSRGLNRTPWYEDEAAV